MGRPRTFGSRPFAIPSQPLSSRMALGSATSSPAYDMTVLRRHGAPGASRWCVAPPSSAGSKATFGAGLRHYFATLLIASGADVKVVQARLRHASAKTTLDTYGHLWPDSDDSTRTAAKAVLEAHALRALAKFLRTARVLLALPDCVFAGQE